MQGHQGAVQRNSFFPKPHKYLPERQERILWPRSALTLLAWKRGPAHA